MLRPMSLLGAALAVTALPLSLAGASHPTVGDALWIWAHPAGVYNDSYLRSTGRVSSIQPAAAAAYMGIRNMIFVCYKGKPRPPYDDYYRPLRSLSRVYWSLVGEAGRTSAATRDGAFTLAEHNENLCGWILDDFFHEPGDGNADDPAALGAAAAATPFRASLTPAELHALRLRPVRGRPLPLMAVIYTGQVKPGARAHIAEVDQLCLWTSKPEDLRHLESNFAALERLAPGKRLFLGCYMYDFHDRKPMPVSLMQLQVETGYRWLKAGRIAGMIFLATANVDIGLDAVEWTRRWIASVSPRSIR